MAPQKIRLCHLYSAIDAWGRPFLKGRIGDARVIIAPRTDIAREGDDATHEMFVVERSVRADARRLDDGRHVDGATESKSEGR